MGLSRTTKGLAVLFLLAAGGGKVIYDDLNDKPNGITNLATVHLAKQDIQDLYNVACGNMKEGKDIAPCGVTLMAATLGLTDVIQRKILATAPVSFGTSNEQTEKDWFIQQNWQRIACGNIDQAETLPQLEEHVSYCLDVGVKVADYFKADENKVLTRVAKKVKDVAKDAARKSPAPGSILV